MFRHEQKYVLNYLQYNEIKNVVSTLMKPDENAGENGEYMIRSLYMDDMYNSAYEQKMDGVYKRKKYRIRTYNLKKDTINFECKHKSDAYIYKEAFPITEEEFNRIMDNDVTFLLKRKEQLAQEIFIDMRTKLLKPVVIVDYEREAYVYDAGTVRVTFDKNVRAAQPDSDFFDWNIPVYDVFMDGSIIMEIKFTGYIPEHIRKIFKVRNFTQTSASKYCMCVDRLNGMI